GALIPTRSGASTPCPWPSPARTGKTTEIRSKFSRPPNVMACGRGLRHHAAPLTMPPWDTNIWVEPNGFWEDPMLSLRVRPLLALCAVVAVLAFAMTDADARAGRGGSFGSRGSQTFSAPPSTTTSPGARPIERSMTQPGQPGGTF